VRPPLDDDVFVTVTSSVNDVVLLLPEESENEPDATVMTAVPPEEREPVNVAVYDVPLPVNPVMVPSVAETSAAENVVVVSLTVNVSVVEEPDETDVGLALMDTVGPAVSKLMDNVLDAVLSLPFASVNLALATEIEPVPDCVLEVGVNVAV
jgi:hypothetical protein